MRRNVKHHLGATIFRTGLHRWILRNAAVVVVFHRVDDRYPDDPLTLTSRQFGDFCDFFAKYFKVVHLSTLVHRMREGRDIGGMLAITFDDGYQDNLKVAAPILVEHGLPACFFITTGFIGSSTVPWWDAKDGITSEWMNWDQVRTLAASGFEVGSHTVSHADLGALRGTQAYQEIADSKARIEDELKQEVSLFAYPYGRPGNICDANRGLARQAGYACCVSAFGGTVGSRTDPFRMRRTPVSSWYLSPYQFGFETLVDHIRAEHSDG